VRGGRPENALPPGNIASVWAEEGYAEATYRLVERTGIKCPVVGAPEEAAALREAEVETRAWWRGLTQEQRRKLRG
jgi:hypothetical protein